jgi:hypothetical protein
MAGSKAPLQKLHQRFTDLEQYIIATAAHGGWLEQYQIRCCSGDRSV